MQKPWHDNVLDIYCLGRGATQHIKKAHFSKHSQYRLEIIKPLLRMTVESKQ